MSTTQFFSNGSALYNNGKVAISKDLIFGLSVYTVDGWRQLKGLDTLDLNSVRHLLDSDPLFMWWEQFEDCERSSALEEDNPVVLPKSTFPNEEKKIYPSWAEVESMSAKKYLEWRAKDYSELLELAEEVYDGLAFHNKSGHTYAVADQFVEGEEIFYDLHSTNFGEGEKRIIQKRLTREEVFAKVLKVFW